MIARFLIVAGTIAMLAALAVPRPTILWIPGFLVLCAGIYQLDKEERS